MKLAYTLTNITITGLFVASCCYLYPQARYEKHVMQNVKQEFGSHIAKPVVLIMLPHKQCHKKGWTKEQAAQVMDIFGINDEYIRNFGKPCRRKS